MTVKKIKFKNKKFLLFPRHKGIEKGGDKLYILGAYPD